MLSSLISVCFPLHGLEKTRLGVFSFPFSSVLSLDHAVSQYRGCLWCSGGELIEPAMVGRDTARGKARAPTSPPFRPHLTQHTSCTPVGEQDESVAG